MAVEALEIVSTAVGVAGFGFGVVRYRGERQASKEATQLREREQADQVSAWAGKRTDLGRQVFVHNASNKIVREVRAWLVAPITPAPSDDALPDREPVTRRAVLEPGGTLEHLIKASSMRGSAPSSRPSVIVAFRDVDGRGWMRTHDGRLLRKELPQAEAPSPAL